MHRLHWDQAGLTTVHCPCSNFALVAYYTVYAVWTIVGANIIAARA